MMISIITIEDNPRSVESSKRCYDSCIEHGIAPGYISTLPAVTPSTVESVNNVFGVEYTSDFDRDGEKYSKPDRAFAAFLSHYRSWWQCYNRDVNTIVLEHDALLTNKIPNTLQGDIVNLGKPSYGKYNNIKDYYVEVDLFSKPYLPGAHGYFITPVGAELLMDRAKEHAQPTDLFISNKNFPGIIKEYYPWPIVADDSFTTIQNRGGCLAKHNYSESGYDII